MAASTPKTMSSRLMTMKFMQRSATNRTSSSASTPNGPPSSKRVRLSHGRSAPGTPDHEILQSALEVEAKKQQEASDKAAQYTGDTKWVLRFKDPLDSARKDAIEVRQAGYAEIDASDDEDEEEVRPVRMQFGGGLKKKKRQSEVQNPQAGENAEDSKSDTSSSDDYDSDDPTAALFRETKRQMNAEKQEAKRARAATRSNSNSGPATPKAQQSKRVDEDSNLGGLTSLSGRAPQRDMSKMECFKCGKKGHMKSECPMVNQRQGHGQDRRGGGGGRGRDRRERF